MKLSIRDAISFCKVCLASEPCTFLCYDVKEHMKAMAHFIWPVMTEKLFSLPLTKVDIHFGHDRMYAMPYPISWIIFILDLEPSYIDKLLESRWVRIAPLS